MFYAVKSAYGAMANAIGFIFCMLLPVILFLVILYPDGIWFLLLMAVLMFVIYTVGSSVTKDDLNSKRDLLSTQLEDELAKELDDVDMYKLTELKKAVFKVENELSKYGGTRKYPEGLKEFEDYCEIKIWGETKQEWNRRKHKIEWDLRRKGEWNESMRYKMPCKRLLSKQRGERNNN